MFQVCVVGGNYAVSLLKVQLIQYCLGYRSSQHGLGTGAKFIDQQEREFIAVPEKIFHIKEVGTVGAQIVFDRLFVTDIDKNTLKNSGFASFLQRNQQSVLQHVLNQSHTLQAYRFAARIGSRYQENVVLFVQDDVKGNNLALFPFERDHQERMNRLFPVKPGLWGKIRFNGIN